jgi:multicomponent Na+:H+ antiporter subunit D
MLAAMGIGAVLCVVIGSFPNLLYSLLPFSAEYHPYDVTHVLTQMQLLLFGALAVVWLMKKGMYPPEIRALNIDADWTYRWLGPRLIRGVGGAVARADAAVRGWVLGTVRGTLRGARQSHGPRGILARTWPTGGMILWVAVLLAAYLVLDFLRQP